MDLAQLRLIEDHLPAGVVLGPTLLEEDQELPPIAWNLHAAGIGLDASGLSLRVILTPPQDVGGHHSQSLTSGFRCCRSVPERRAMSVVEGSEELERPPRRTPTLCLMSTVVVGDAQHPGKLPERRVLLDLSIGACSAMYPHMLQ